MTLTPVDIPAFAATQLQLLAAELQTETQENAAAIGSHTPAALQRAGRALTNLTVDGRRTGMGGRTVLTLALDGAVRVAAGPVSRGRPAKTGGKGKLGKTATKGGKTADKTAQAGQDDGNGPDLPAHGLRVGDIVLVAEQPGGSAKKREMRELESRGVRGVITRVRRSMLEVGLDGGGGGGGDADEGETLDGLLSGRVWLVKLADDVTYRRMAKTMQALQAMPAAAYTRLIQVLFGLQSPGSSERSEEKDIEWIDGTLNASQQEAVRFALAADEVALIHGPPGTGKTHTLVELILQLVGRGQRVLVCGPSNISVDNLVERLAPRGVPMVRLGHPARLLPSVVRHALDVLTQTSEAGAIVRDVRTEMDARQASLRGSGKKDKKDKTPYAERRAARRATYAELRALRREYREREQRCVRDIVAGSRVVLATLHGAGSSQLRAAATGEGEGAASAAFDVVIIDEASQALEAQCWVALLGARKVVCAGDHLQLPPTVKAKGSKGLDHTLFDRLLALHGNAIKRMLTTQYRMHERIMRFPSDALYDGRLVAAAGVRARLLRDIRYGAEAEEGGKGEDDKGDGDGDDHHTRIADTDDTREPLVFIDTQGGAFAEADDADKPDHDKPRLSLTDSKSNPAEAALVRQHVHALVAAGLRPADLAVVTPYSAQVALLAPLKTALPGLEVGTVDGFQGREKEAVIVSLVRSNAAGTVGFLAEKRRLNVAMTRPRRSLTVIGDSETAARGSPFLKAWMGFLEENADLRYPDPTAAREYEE